MLILFNLKKEKKGKKRRKKSMLNTKWWAVYRLGPPLVKLHGGTPLLTC